MRKTSCKDEGITFDLLRTGLETSHKNGSVSQKWQRSRTKVYNMKVHIHTVPQILFILICYWIPVFCTHSQPESTKWIPPRIFQGAGTKHVATGKLWHKHCMLQSMPPAIALNLETSWPARSWKRLKEHLWGVGYMTRLGKSPWFGSHITHIPVIKRGNWNSRFMADCSF